MKNIISALMLIGKVIPHDDFCEIEKQEDYRLIIEFVNGISVLEINFISQDRAKKYIVMQKDKYSLVYDYSSNALHIDNKTMSLKEFEKYANDIDTNFFFVAHSYLTSLKKKF